MSTCIWLLLVWFGWWFPTQSNVHLLPPSYPISRQNEPTTGFVVEEDDEHDPLASKDGRYSRVPPTVSAGAEEEGLIGATAAATADGDVLVQAGAAPEGSGGEAEMTVRGGCLCVHVYNTPLNLMYMHIHIHTQCTQSLAAVQNARGDTSCGIKDGEGGGKGGGKGGGGGKKKGGFFSGGGRR